MIILDLLPLKEKKQLYIKKVYSIFKKIITTSLIQIALISVLLVGSAFLLENDASYIKNQNNLLIKSNKGLNNKINKYNKELIYLSTIQSEHKNFSKIIIKITNLVPPKIKLSGLTIQQSVNTKNFILKIKGISKNREALLTFKDALNSVDFIKKFELPINNLLKQKNINFEFSTIIYLDNNYKK